ncbi:hypothetical protein EVAR_65738_1 [Eumeta japonica]|uniref:Uncharacterized protein n=1 Tax=Eumeta variegata TaxID=151549 RepID=A0A4C1ZMG1_EUMVA|nr:hypothetical protein EVAR_65738_1 [Eumeta japonica]
MARKFPTYPTPVAAALFFFTENHITGPPSPSADAKFRYISGRYGKAAWLPVIVRSWTALRLDYSVAHYTYASRGFDYAAAYSFNDDALCGQRTFTTHSGEHALEIES